VELFPDDHDALRLANHTVTLAELLREHTDGWSPPHLERQVLAQAHCHHHAVMGYDPDLALLRDMGAHAEHLESGCCGLAGNFGFQPGHFEVSRDCAERVLLPRVRDAADAAVVLADGFSCRTQVEQLGGGRVPVHLAELLRAGLRGDPARDGTRPEAAYAPRPAVPSRTARAGALAGVSAAAAAVPALAWAVARRFRS
jgi:Fe-S oxidoreductase